MTESVTIGRPVAEVYRFFRELENLPRFMTYLEEVTRLDAVRSHWVARGPFGQRFEWDAEITEDQTDRLIAWRPLAGSDVEHEGTARFQPAPGGRGTEVHVHLRYRPPFGALGRGVARLLGREPGQEVKGDLRRLKQVLEIGEIVRSDASIHTGPHPAQPAARGDRTGEEERP